MLAEHHRVQLIAADCLKWTSKHTCMETLFLLIALCIKQLFQVQIKGMQIKGVLYV
jgi:hypothetical protein